MPCSRLSWLLLCFWAHVKIVISYRIVCPLHFAVYIICSLDQSQRSVCERKLSRIELALITESCFRKEKTCESFHDTRGIFFRKPLSNETFQCVMTFRGLHGDRNYTHPRKNCFRLHSIPAITAVCRIIMASAVTKYVMNSRTYYQLTDNNTLSV